MKKILCYGDSNTFGFNPVNGKRFDKDTRWSGILQTHLKPDFDLIEEGANNRTAFVINPAGALYSAQTHFLNIISNSKDLNILIFSLGTNDLQTQYDIDFHTIEKELEKLIVTSKQYSKNIILIPPVVLDYNSLSKFFKGLFNEISAQKSQTVGEIYKIAAEKHNCYLFDFNEITPPSKTDGIHYDEIAHKIIAEKFEKFILKTFG